MREPSATIRTTPSSATKAEAWGSVYLVGIGGCGMSGLARYLRALGADVSGSDMTRSRVTEALLDEGIDVRFEQDAGEVPEGCNTVIASAAIKPGHAEIMRAEHRGLRVLSYAEALGLCMLGKTGVSIAGTHGKSTTVGMLGHALIQSGLEPTVIIGATSTALGGENGSSGFRQGEPVIPRGSRAGEPGILIAESCEFNRSFHHHRPTVGAITCVEADHLDVYGSLDAVVKAFGEFAQLVPNAKDGGTLIIGHEGAHRREITGGVTCDVQTLGFAPAADWQVTFDSVRRLVGLVRKGKPIAHWTNLSPGDHMALNSAFAAAIAITLGAEPAKVAEALSSFPGVDRRMQLLGEKPSPAGGAVRVYDDYGHHPTEIDETLRAIREYEFADGHGGRLICVFQPHQHSRTRFLLDEFAQSFSRADVVIVPHIFFVRDSEVEKSRVSAADLVDRLRARGVLAMHLYPFEAIVEQLQNVCRGGDVLVVMGAGPVWQVARGFMESGAS